MTEIDTTTAAVTALLDGVTEGPWDWQVSAVSRAVELSGGRQSKAGGDLTVMSFRRWGLHSAAPVFWTWKGNYATRIDRADALAAHEPGREHHKAWFSRIDHPDARFIAAARQLVPALLAERDALAARLQAAHAALAEIATAELDELPQPPHSARNPPWEDADPVVNAEDAWALQQTARDALKEMETDK